MDSNNGLSIGPDAAAHAGYFMADIFVVEGAAVVKANGPVSPDKLFRHREFGPPSHQLVDFPAAGMWAPDRGVFVVPAEQVTVIRSAK